MLYPNLTKLLMLDSNTLKYLRVQKMINIEYNYSFYIAIFETI